MKKHRNDGIPGNGNGSARGSGNGGIPQDGNGRVPANGNEFAFFTYHELQIILKSMLKEIQEGATPDLTLKKRAILYEFIYGTIKRDQGEEKAERDIVKDIEKYREQYLAGIRRFLQFLDNMK